MLCYDETCALRREIVYRKIPRDNSLDFTISLRSILSFLLLPQLYSHGSSKIDNVSCVSTCVYPSRFPVALLFRFAEKARSNGKKKGGTREKHSLSQILCCLSYFPRLAFLFYTLISSRDSDRSCCSVTTTVLLAIEGFYSDLLHSRFVVRWKNGSVGY